MTDALANNSGISASQSTSTNCFVNTAARLTQQYGAQLNRKAITFIAVTFATFSSDCLRLSWICGKFPGTTAR